MADKVWRRSQSGHKAGQKADTRRTQAETWRTHGGQSVETRPKRNQGRHKARTMADKWRTSSGDVARAYRGQPFFLLVRENPTVNCLGEIPFESLLVSPRIGFA